MTHPSLSMRRYDSCQAAQHKCRLAVHPQAGSAAGRGHCTHTKIHSTSPSIIKFARNKDNTQNYYK